MTKVIIVTAVILVILFLSLIAVVVFRPQHKMSRDFLVAGRRSVAMIERYPDRLWGDDLHRMGEGAKLIREAEINHANDWDKEATVFLRNYWAATIYASDLDKVVSDYEIATSTDKYCAEQRRLHPRSRGCEDDVPKKEKDAEQERYTRMTRFCADHHCKELYAVCKEEAEMFDTGIVPRKLRCDRNLVEESERMDDGTLGWSRQSEWLAAGISVTVLFFIFSPRTDSRFALLRSTATGTVATGGEGRRKSRKPKEAEGKLGEALMQLELQVNERIAPAAATHPAKSPA